MLTIYFTVSLGPAVRWSLRVLHPSFLGLLAVLQRQLVPRAGISAYAGRGRSLPAVLRARRPPLRRLPALTTGPPPSTPARRRPRPQERLQHRVAASSK